MSCFVILKMSHYNDVIMSTMVSQITGVSIVCSTVGLGADQRKHISSASLVFVWGIHRSPVNSPHKRPITRKMFPFDDVIMICRIPSIKTNHKDSIKRSADFYSSSLDKMTANFAEDIFKCILLNENDKIAIQISMKFVPMGTIDNMPAMVQTMAWRLLGNKPLPEPIMAQFIEALMRQ